MTFAWPHLLWLLIAPAGLLAWELSHRRKAAAVNVHPKIMRVEAGTNQVQLARDNAPLPTGPKPRVWLCIGLALAVGALARPQWGRLEEPVFDQSREILLAVDLSRSMLTPDVMPSRLDRAKLLIQSLLEKLAGERVGLVVFAGTAFLQSPLSADYEILREFLPALGPDFLPQGGTNYRALIDTSIEAFGAAASADRYLIVLSDGEATDEDWKSRVDELKKKNIRVIGLGVGTAGGAMIPDGTGGFVKDERGAVVLSKLESGTLTELAQSTSGAYRDASSWVDLAVLLKETVETGQKGQFVEKNTIRLVERFQWPLAFGVWCLFVSLCYEFPVRPRPRAIPLNSGNRKADTGKIAVAAVIALLVSGFAYPVSGFAAATIAKPPPLNVSPPAAAPADPTALAKIVTRLSAADNRSARDWAELARETVTWGSQLKSAQQTVPEGPVRDALAAVDLGSKLDAKTADWSKLREDLEALLKKPDEQKQENKQDQQQQKQDQQNQDQNQNSDQKQQSQQNQSSDPQKGQPNKEPETPNENPSEQNKSPEEQKPPGESAFGDMKQKEPPPPPPGDTQKVGGAPEKKEEATEPPDPALALPLQKLEQLKNQDSPAQLFQLMEGEKKPAKKAGKDW
ncbi:MAG: VWA domain-containing protein [Opitutaceae bacterium]|nr:VWA domain-containing protein [Opitutaceae bacterium]